MFISKLVIPVLICVSAMSCAKAPPSSSVSPNSTQVKTNGAKISYDALNDFQLLNAGDVPYYLDTRNNALGIDARFHEYRNLYARASRPFDGKTGTYDIVIHPVTEEDGEPLYRLLVNDKIMGTYRASYIGKGSPKDLTPETHTWTGISLTKGDVISIESAAHTNGEIPEHGGTAWARGRWQKIELFATGVKEPNRAHFNHHSDLLVAQFDLKPDADDIHAVAALGSALVHPDMENVNLVAVAGTIGNQNGHYYDSPDLFTLAFGQEDFGWTDANKDWQRSVIYIRDRVRAVLAQGGKAWVQEAGQSDFTRDWVEALLKSGVSEPLVKNNVIVVQHSDWNEEKTTAEDLAFVKQKTHYQRLSDGNKPLRIFDRKNRKGPPTPMYVDLQSKWLAAATSSDNTKQQARKLWQEAYRLIENSSFDHAHSVIPKGGVDFSDMVETWWILNLGQPAVSVHSFWERYVTDVELDAVNPPKGRLAIVIDGNSPDPDDIGATPVMFGLLQQTGLSDRLVHLSHSCDLDPTKNKGHQIDAKSELRRQKKLHELSGRGVTLFGPFNNLRNYYNCRVDQPAATQDLVDAINASTEQDPLWIIEAGEPDLIGYALQASNPEVHQYVHVVSHHPANDDSGDYFTWQQILDFGVTEHQIGDQNLGLQTPISPWDWAKEKNDPRFTFIWEMMAYAEQDGIVPFQANKFDCSDAGMIYWWITGANQGGNKDSTAADMKDMLLLKGNK